MVTTFPYENSLIQGAFKVFDLSSQKILTEYAPVVFLARVLFNQVALKGKEHYGLLVRDTVFMFIGIMCFRQFMELIIGIPAEAEELLWVFGKPTVELAADKDSIFNKPLPGLLGLSLANLDIILGEVLKFIAVAVYWIVYWLYFMFIFLAICCGAFVIFFASMFRVQWVLSSFVVLILIASLWPFLWYASDFLLTFAADELAKKGSGLGILTSSIITNSIKLLVPLLTFLWAIKDPVKIVSNAGQGIAQTFATLVAPAKMAMAKGGAAATKMGIDKLARTSMTSLREARIQRAGSRMLPQSETGGYYGYDRVLSETKARPQSRQSVVTETEKKITNRLLNDSGTNLSYPDATVRRKKVKQIVELEIQASLNQAGAFKLPEQVLTRGEVRKIEQRTVARLQTNQEIVASESAIFSKMNSRAGVQIPEQTSRQELRQYTHIHRKKITEITDEDVEKITHRISYNNSFDQERG